MNCIILIDAGVTNVFPSRYVSVGVVSLGHYFFVSYFYGEVAYLFDILLEFFLKLSRFGLNKFVDGEVQVKVIVTDFYLINLSKIPGI